MPFVQSTDRDYSARHSDRSRPDLFRVRPSAKTKLDCMVVAVRASSANVSVRLVCAPLFEPLRKDRLSASG